MAAQLLNDRPLDDAEKEVLNKLGIETPTAPTTTEEDIPDKYRGKSAADLVKMHQEAEKAIGRQGQELGDLRKVVDDILVKQTETISKKDPPKEIDFFEDPKAAVAQTIESHPVVNELKKHTENARRSSAQAELMRRHPDALQLVADANFLEFATATPTRKALLLKADSELDVDAADELFTNYKERQKLAAQAASSEKNSREATVKAASTGSTRVSGEATTTTKKYRRADIINLMRTDPARYEALAAEIRRAYAEGRVID